MNGIDVARSRVGVMGFTFKENCPDVRNSKVVDIVKELQSYGIDVVVADPHADPHEVEEEYGLKLGRIDADHAVDSLVVQERNAAWTEAHPDGLDSLAATGIWRTP